MVSSRLLLIGIVLTTIAGCTAVSVRSVNSDLGIKHVCIEDGQEACFDGQMIGIIEDGFQRHGITTEVYDGELPPECEYHLTYMCERTWDLAMYMTHAELRLYKGRSQIGNAEYHLKGKGGFSPGKWARTKDKMDPVIDELLSAYPIVH